MGNQWVRPFRTGRKLRNKKGRDKKRMPGQLDDAGFSILSSLRDFQPALFQCLLIGEGAGPHDGLRFDYTLCERANLICKLAPTAFAYRLNVDRRTSLA
jgi:hypothetical protein